MKIQYFIQTDRNPAPVYIRLNDGRRFDLRVKTGLVINPDFWSAPRWRPGQPKSNLRDAHAKGICRQIDSRLKEIDRDLTAKYNATSDKGQINKSWLQSYFKPDQAAAETDTVPTGLLAYFEYY